MDIIELTSLPHVLDGPFTGGLFYLQQDGASVHTAKAVSNMLDTLGVMRLQWPLRRPDLNIENVWGIMKNLAEQPNLPIGTSEQLWQAIEKEWKSLRQREDIVDALQDSLPKRI